MAVIDFKSILHIVDSRIMAVLSYRDLQKRISGGWVHGPASIDLPHGNIYHIPKDYWDANFKDRWSPVSVPRDELLENVELYTKDSMEGHYFYTEVPIPEETKHYQRMLGMRSNVARNGLLGIEWEKVHDMPPNTIPILLKTCGTVIETPSYSFSQLFLREWGTKRLTVDEIKAALDRHDVAQ